MTSLVRLRARPDTLYLSRGRTVLATDRDGWVHGFVRLERGAIVRVECASTPAAATDAGIHFAIDRPSHGEWHACLIVTPLIDGARLAPPRECRRLVAAMERTSMFLNDATRFRSEGSETLTPVVLGALAPAKHDLDALRLPDLDHGPHAWTMAAGLPMYVALFGRDTLTTAWQAALLGPDMMRGTLAELERWQGRATNDWRDEQPGRMLHEAHTGPLERLNVNPRARSYSSITTQIAYPDRQCVAFVGDGGFSMLMAELATCVKYQLPIKVVIVKNNTLGMIKWEQMVFLGNPEYGCELQPIDYAAFARACGAAGFTVDDPAPCGAVLDEALAIKGPAVVEAVVDPFVPPMPPTITMEQAAKFGEALLKGTPNREKIALTVLSDKVKELI